MNKAKSQQQASFSLDEFLDFEMKRKSTRELLAAVYEEDDHLLIIPSPCTSGTALRVRKSFVEVGEVLDFTCPDGKQKEVYRIRIRCDAPCLFIEAGTAEQLLDRLVPFGEIETRVKSAKINLKPDGTGTLSYANKTVPCLGKAGYSYKLDITNQGTEGSEKFKEKFSNEFQVTMYWAVLIDGERGVYIHEGATTGTSAGCIHLAVPEAKKFYDWVDQPTRITISVPW